MRTPGKKYFVLDTNVVLHDSACIYQFADNNIVLPITVLEELDNFKKGNDAVNFHAREFVRALDALSGEKLFAEGVKIGPKLGKISIKLEQKIHPHLKFSFTGNKPDHLILNTAYSLSKQYPAGHVILVTKDVNLRMKAKSVGLTAQDYKTDQIRDISTLYKGFRVVEDVPKSVVNQMYCVPFEVTPEKVPVKNPFKPNEYIILRHNKRSALAAFDALHGCIRRVDKPTAYGIKPRNAEQAFALDALMNPDIRLVSLTGKAGTGKTLLALAAALEKNKSYRQIYLARPVMPLSNKDIGFLPGSVDAKLSPYMQPMFDNLSVIQHQFQESDPKSKRIKDFLEEDKLVITPLAFIRGRSLVRTYFIVDEAQNLTPHEIKTIITRAGEGTKLVFTGDVFQIDHPYLDSLSNGLSYLIDKMQEQKIYAHINLEKGERSELSELASHLL
jgi:PhoH-like ATPase